MNNINNYLFKKSSQPIYNHYDTCDSLNNLKQEDMPIAIYTPSKDKFIDLTPKAICKWYDLDIITSLYMKISFCINIKTIVNNPRNIFHITNNNEDNSRVPSIWIDNNTILSVCCSTIDDPYDYFLLPRIPLNVSTNVLIIWKRQIVEVYFNNRHVKSHFFKSPLIPANDDATVYICDKWRSVGGFSIKNLTFDNNVFKSCSSISKLKNNDMPDWLYTPSKDNFITLVPKQIGIWSDLNIKSSLNMELSFCIKIETIENNHRNILHITNTNKYNSKVPSLWINRNSSHLLLHNNRVNYSTAKLLLPQIEINKVTNVIILWKEQLILVYYNNILVHRYISDHKLVQANNDAIVYLSDKWYSNGGFVIKNLTINNNITTPIIPTTNLPPSIILHPSIPPIKLDLSNPMGLPKPIYSSDPSQPIKLPEAKPIDPSRPVELPKPIIPINMPQPIYPSQTSYPEIPSYPSKPLDPAKSSGPYKPTYPSKTSYSSDLSNRFYSSEFSKQSYPSDSSNLGNSLIKKYNTIEGYVSDPSNPTQINKSNSTEINKSSPTNNGYIPLYSSKSINNEYNPLNSSKSINNGYNPLNLSKSINSGYTPLKSSNPTDLYSKTVLSKQNNSVKISSLGNSLIKKYYNTIETNKNTHQNISKELNDKEKQLEYKKKVEMNQAKEIEDKEKILLTRSRMLQISQDRISYRKKIIYSLLAVVFAIFIIMITLYVLFFKNIDFKNII